MYVSIAQRTQQRELADHQLVAQACAGDHLAFETLVQRYQNMLYRFVNAYLGNEQTHDVVQFVWFQCYLSLPKLLRTRPVGRSDESLKPWLCRVARNRCLDEMRRCKRYPVLFSEVEHANEEEDTSVLSILPDPAPLPEELMEQHDEQDCLRAAIQTLPSKSRAVVWLRYKEELSFSEIGCRLNMPPTSVKTYFYRACAKLRAELSTQGVRAATGAC